MPQLFTFLKTLIQKVAAAFPAAESLTVILDNLNTHNESSFYEAFSAEEAKRLSDKFEFVYTPPKASWLNMIEIEFSAVSRLCTTDNSDDCGTPIISHCWYQFSSLINISL